jgi:hypothetical protein
MEIQNLTFLINLRIPHKHYGANFDQLGINTLLLFHCSEFPQNNFLLSQKSPRLMDTWAYKCCTKSWHIKIKYTVTDSAKKLKLFTRNIVKTLFNLFIFIALLAPH